MATWATQCVCVCFPHSQAERTCVPQKRPGSHLVRGMHGVMHDMPSGAHESPGVHSPLLGPHAMKSPQPSSSVPHTLPSAHCPRRGQSKVTGGNGGEPSVRAAP